MIQTISSDGVSMFLNCLYEASNDPKPAVKKESLRLIALLCTTHGDSTSTHLTKIIAHIVKRLRDSDSGVRDACRDAIGGLASQYLKGEVDNGNLGLVVSLFVKPLFEAMGEEKKAVQAGAAMCMAKMVECAVEIPVSSFQKLCPRICKYLNSQQFLAKAALLSVIASLSQVGAIAPQSMPTLLQSIHECLESSDWTTRKAAAETLSVLASHSSHLITERASTIITAIEASRFDKVKPVRESMIDALHALKKVVEKGCDAVPDNSNAISCDEKESEAGESTEKPGLQNRNPTDEKIEAASGQLAVSSTSNSPSEINGRAASDKTVAVLKKKAPTLSNKVVNPEFFQKLETRDSDDIPVEVVVPCRIPNSSNTKNEEKLDPNNTAYRGISSRDGTDGLGDGHVPGNSRYDSSERERPGLFSKQHDMDDSTRERWTESRAFRRRDLIPRNADVNDRVENTQRDQSNLEGTFPENKGNWITIQRQLSQMERQQTHLMNMLQDYMSGSHNSMVTLENRVRGLERIVEDMQRELTLSSGRRAGNYMMGFEGSSGRSLGKYNGFSDYSSPKIRRDGEGRGHFTERFHPSDAIASGARGSDQPWRSEPSEKWDSYPYETSRNGYAGSRRVGSAMNDGRSSRLENDGDQVSARRAWDKVPGRVRLGEGPSARSVWHASKDEATLEAIRVAGDENGTSRPAAHVPVPEGAKTLGDGNVSDQDQELAIWSNAMDAIHMGNMEMAYAEVMSSGDDFLLVKLMDKSGPVMEQLSDEMVFEILHAVRQFLMDQSLFDIALSWIQQLVDLVMENGPDVFAIPFENKRDLLLSLHEASSKFDPPENWEGGMPDQLMLQLASAWEIDLQ